MMRIIREAGFKNGRRAVVAQCLCGKSVVTEIYKLKRKNCAMKSCGCGQHTRGLPSTYHSWKSMKDRCLVKSYHAYKNYGGRGIKINPMWIGKDGFKNFVEDLGERPEGRTLDRIDNNSDYTKKNCRWATAKEQGENRRNSTALHVRRMLESLGLDLNDPNLRETGLRVAKSLKDDLLKGYKASPSDVLTTWFPSDNNEMVILKNIEIYSTCSHHLLPFTGVAHVAYIPNGRVVGLSKLARVVEIYARRLQLQEQLTDQVAEALTKYLKPRGVMVVIDAKHMCMCARGVQKQGSSMVTSSVRGLFKTDPKARGEFLGLIK